MRDRHLWCIHRKGKVMRAPLIAFVLGLALSVVSGLPSYAAAGSTKAVKQIEALASLNEDLVDYALAGDANRMAKSLQAITKAVPQLKAVLAKPAFSQLTTQLAAQQSAVKQGNTTLVALASIEMYRILENAIDPSLRTVPAEISMLDYSGFKIVTLARAPTTDWTAVHAVVGDMNHNWQALSPRIKETALKGLVNSIKSGVEEAVDRKDTHYLAFAGKMLLDTVDLLEGQFG